MMIDKLEILRGMNGFVVITGQPIADMIVFTTWDDVVEYLSEQAGLWGRKRYLEVSPDWEHAPEWATGWQQKAHWVGDGEEQNTYSYSEQRPEVE